MSIHEAAFDPLPNCITSEQSNGGFRSDCRWPSTCRVLGRCILADPELERALEADAYDPLMEALEDAWNDGYAAAAEEASYDPLTGYKRRQNMTEMIENFTEQAVANQDNYAFIIFADMDDFSRMNNGFVREDGSVVEPDHHRGDVALQAWSRHARRTLRHGDDERGHDLFIRWGGDEFAILMSSSIRPDRSEWEREYADEHSYVEARMAAMLAHRLRDVPFTYASEVFTTSASVAVRALDLHDFQDEPFRLMHELDVEMYAHKEARKEQLRAEKMDRYATEGTAEFS